MQVVVETVSPLERKVKVTVPFEKIDQEVKKRVQNLTKTAKIDGFRPGKVPEQVIRQRFGKGIEYEALNQVVQHSLDEALQQEKLVPAGMPDLKFGNYESGKPFDYTATFEVFPEIELKPFSELVVEQLQSEVTEEDLQKTLTGMQKQQTQWEEVDREAKDGDRLTITFEGTINGEAFKGGSAEDMPLILGSHSTIAGFEEGLIKSKKGQAVVLDLTFPADYGVEDLKGKPVQFKITVNKIEQPNMPTIDEAFAKQFGVADGSVEKLHEEVKDTMNHQLKESLRQKLKSEVMSKLYEQYKAVEVPKALIHQEAEHLMKQMMAQFGQLKGMKQPAMKSDMFHERAKERVTLGLVINALVKRDELKPDADKVRELITNIASRYDHPEQVISWYYSQKDRMAEMESVALEEQVIDKILAEATVVEKTVKASEVLNPGGMI